MTPDDRRYLEGAQGRGSELRHTFRVFREYVRAIRALHFLGPCVTVFGSARFPEAHPYYQLARTVGVGLANRGFTVMTGGGPGIMEAANRGAREAGGLSIGLNVQLPHEQAPNPFTDHVFTFRYFFIRKVMLVKYSYGFIALPGGLGTYDELFEVTTLIQTGKLNDFPVVLVGADYWQPFVDHMRGNMLAAGTIDPADVDRLHVTDSPDEAVAFVHARILRKFGLAYRRQPQRRWFLWERSGTRRR
jgi:hypothetical protein